MTGAFRRRLISFADGLSDTDTRVFWLQSRGLTIDLRLPMLPEQQALPLPALHDPASLEGLADLEGWYAHSRWHNNQLSWLDGCSFQLHNRWPEPAQLRRIGNAMIEFAPSDAYVEDWRLLNRPTVGPLIGLELESQTDCRSGQVWPRRGALIIAGEYAGLVLGRWRPEVESGDLTLKQRLLAPATDPLQRQQLLGFETSIGYRSADADTWVVEHSLCQSRVGQPLLDLDGFAAADGYLQQSVYERGRWWLRRWRIDSLEPAFTFASHTPVTCADSEAWRRRESPTLDRYTRVLV